MSNEIPTDPIFHAIEIQPKLKPDKKPPLTIQQVLGYGPRITAPIINPRPPQPPAAPKTMAELMAHHARDRRRSSRERFLAAANQEAQGVALAAYLKAMRSMKRDPATGATSPTPPVPATTAA